MLTIHGILTEIFLRPLMQIVRNKKNTSNRKGLNASVNVAWGDALTSQVCLFVDSYYRGRRVRVTYIPESNSSYIVNRVCIHVLCSCVSSPVSIHSCIQALLYCGIRESIDSDGFEPFPIRSNTVQQTFHFINNIHPYYFSNSHFITIILHYG